MKLHKRLIVSTIALALAGQFSALPARDSLDQRLIEEAAPIIEKSTDGFIVEAPYINNLVVMNVRVYSQQGEQVLYVRSQGEPVELLAADLPDGKYRYEVNTVFSLDEPVGEGADSREEGISRESGQFSIQSGELVKGEFEDGKEELGMTELLKNHSVAVLEFILSSMVTEVHAQNLTASSTGPGVFFVDTKFGATTEASIRFGSDAPPGPTGGGYFYIKTETDTQSANILRADYTSINQVPLIKMTDSLVTIAGLGGSAMYVDTFNNIVSIGDQASGTTQDLYLSNAKPGLRFHDEADTSEVELELSAGDFRFWGRADDSGALWRIPFRIDVNAPTNSLAIVSDGTVTMGSTLHIGADTPTGHSLMITSVAPANPPEIDLNYPGNSGVEIEMSDSRLRFNLDSDGDDSPDEYDVLNINKFAPANTLSISAAGNIGNGIFFPLAPIHVQRSDGTAKLLVEETNGTAAARTLLHLMNNGATSFGMHNTEAKVEWAFTNTGTGLQFSQVGSGAVEMEILNNGNLVIAGGLSVASDVNSKTAITDVDPEEILSLVTKLPVSKWEYKDALGEKHIGPMAQDFYAAFGLGATDTSISTIDTAGVALAAIQALNNKLINQNMSLERRVHELEQQNQRIEELVMLMVSERAEKVAAY